MDYLHEPFLFYCQPRYNNKLKLMKKVAKIEKDGLKIDVITITNSYR